MGSEDVIRHNNLQWKKYAEARNRLANLSLSKETKEDALRVIRQYEKDNPGEPQTRSYNGDKNA